MTLKSGCFCPAMTAIVRKQKIITGSSFEYAGFFIGFYSNSNWLTTPVLPINAKKSPIVFGFKCSLNVQIYVNFSSGYSIFF